MDPKHISPPSGPKCKPVEQSYAHATSIDNKQKVEDDPRTLENFVTDDLGSAVATGSTARSNECAKLELSGVWEPPNS